MVLSMRPLLGWLVWCQARISSDQAMMVLSMSWYVSESTCGRAAAMLVNGPLLQLAGRIRTRREELKPSLVGLMG